ncbi:protein-export chaperone SecB [Cytobacillus kochii]|uniref:hypothetical protein n=1 Tax=Cytobacillus kochii TaxID=859143 RepID=UPI002E1CF316|nr:protein-export chaperone SecB [Cytobacillus kochii]
MELVEYYNFIRNSIQLVDAELISMTCKSDKSFQSENEIEIPMLFQRRVELISQNKMEIYLRAEVGMKDGPFYFDIEYRGKCLALSEIEEKEFERYSLDQVVPLLLPYVRECVTSTMAKMDLPIYTIPTMDVLGTLEVNLPPDGQE